MNNSYLPEGMPIPVPQSDGLDKHYWEATRRGELMIQKCSDCGTWQWGPEWICHNCNSFNMEWKEIDWQRERWEIPSEKMKMRNAEKAMPHTPIRQ